MKKKQKSNIYLTSDNTKLKNCCIKKKNNLHDTFLAYNKLSKLH